MKFETKYQKSFKKRMLRTLCYSIFFSSVIALIAFLFQESFYDRDSWRGLCWQVLFSNLIFGIPLFISLYKSNRFIIKKLSLDDIYIFLEYSEYDTFKKIKLPIEKTRIELIQWRNINSIYLKLSTNNIKIRQYRGGAWSADQLREIYKALKEAKKNLEVE